jgi:uncharacterized protein (DUF1778 family)
MAIHQKKVVVNKFPLRLMPSVRQVAERLSRQEGVSLNQFINLAVAEKVAYLQHEEWLERRSRISQDSIAKALQILDRPSKRKPAAGDELPDGYASARRKQVRQVRGTR